MSLMLSVIMLNDVVAVVITAAILIEGLVMTSAL
jgi:hypothetical protein